MNNQVLVVAILTPNEHSGVIESFPPRLSDYDSVNRAAPLTPDCFEGGEFPPIVGELLDDAKRARSGVLFISWPDGTRAAVFFPQELLSIPVECAIDIYNVARDTREAVMLENTTEVCN